ncbi:MAG: hypothetical protein WBE22_05860, partial [Halobacteriota archaeon]
MGQLSNYKDFVLRLSKEAPHLYPALAIVNDSVAAAQSVELRTDEAVPQINHRTLLYIKTMTVNQHKSKIHDTPGVNTNKILKNCY